MFYVFVLVCCSCVVSFQFKELICIILFLCCCFFVTRLSGLIVCILWSFFLFCFLLFCFEFCLFLFFHSSQKKDPPKNRTQQKPKEAKMQKNHTAKKKLAQLCSQNSVLQFFGVGLKFSFLAENTIKIVVSVHFKTGKHTQKLAKMLSRNLVQGCVKTWSKYVAQQNWTKF